MYNSYSYSYARGRRQLSPSKYIGLATSTRRRIDGSAARSMFSSRDE